MRSNLDTRDFGIIRNAVQNTLRAALIDVVLPGQHFQPRRIDVEREILAELVSISSEEIAECVVRRADAQSGRPFLHLGFFRDQLPDIIDLGLFRPRVIKRFVRQHNVLVFLLESNDDLSQSVPGVFDFQVQSRRPSQRLEVMVERDLRRLSFPSPVGKGKPGHEDYRNQEEQDHPNGDSPGASADFCHENTPEQNCILGAGKEI